MRADAVGLLKKIINFYREMQFTFRNFENFNVFVVKCIQQQNTRMYLLRF